MTVTPSASLRSATPPSRGRRAPYSAPLLRVALVIVPFFLPATALAHGDAHVSPQTIWTDWSPPVFMSVLLLALFVVCGAGVMRLHARSTRWSGGDGIRAALLLTGLGLTAFALISPLETLSGTLLSAHMVQHVILIAVAPLCIAFGRPEAAAMWGLPRRWRRALGRSRVIHRVTSVWRRLEQPVTATVLHGIAVWLWHTPALFDAALENSFLHDLEHLSFFLTALLFWGGVARARTPSARAKAALCCLTTLIHSGFLGALLTFSETRIYGADAVAIGLWGLTPLSDQQLAGVIMWVPGSIAYLGAAILLCAGLLNPSEGRREQSRPASVA